MDHRHLLALLYQLLDHGAGAGVFLKGLLDGGIVLDAVHMYALAEGGVYGLYNVCFMLTYKGAKLLQSLLSGLFILADAQHIPLEKVFELLVSEVFVFKHIGIFRVVHSGVEAHSYTLRYKRGAIFLIFPLKPELKILIVIGAVFHQAMGHIPLQPPDISLVLQLLRAFILADDLVYLPVLAVIVVTLTVPGLETDLSVYLSPELAQHWTHSLSLCGKNTLNTLTV